MGSLEASRWLAAGLAIALYAMLCLAAWCRARRQSADHLPCLAADDAAWQVVYASQTGNAEAIARQSADLLARAGWAVQCYALNRLDAPRLAAGGRFLFILSTAGEGDAPDNAARFVRDCLGEAPDLSGVDYALLGLGDRQYPQFNAFGRRVDAWLVGCGARRSFDSSEVDRCAAEALAHWQQQLARLVGAGDVAAWAEADFLPWTLVDRQHLNPGSQGQPVYRLRFQPAAGGMPDWQAGDLAQIVPPVDGERPREYSIASLPGQGYLELLVRLQVRDDGQPGLVSGWLNHRLMIGRSASLRIRPHPGFRLGSNVDRPLLLIANGVGLAGVMAHLRNRIACGRRDNWLIFGERNAEYDHLQRDELAAWQRTGDLARLDTVFSRDGGTRRYVQQVVAANAQEILDWLARGAAIYVCGSRLGMGEGVDQALLELLGRAGLDALVDEGRYRRDVF